LYNLRAVYQGGDIMAKSNRLTIPLIPVRGLVVFPYMVLHFDVVRKKSIAALEEAMTNNQLIFLTSQHDGLLEDVTENDFYKIGTVSKIKQLLKLPGDSIRVLVEGLYRAKIREVTKTEPFFEVEVVEKKSTNGDLDELEFEAIVRQISYIFEDYYRLSPKVSPDAIQSILSISDPGQFADTVAANIVKKNEDKQSILEEFNVKNRLEKLLLILSREVEVLEIEKNIANKVRSQIDKNQRDYYLREQLKIIRSELGEGDDIASEVEEYRQKLEAASIPDEGKEKLKKEISRLEKMSSSSAEAAVIRTYLDTVFDLPWDSRTEESLDLIKAAKILDEDHYGLTDVKERILEYLAVKKLSPNIKGSILCLVGPPGVGKTSIVRSIAKALNRKYVRMSLGGVRDESEIRGHRKTYVGAMPGRIINALRIAGSKNALILLDEIDKMSSDFRGDPASAMLEVLDAEQNYAFRDHYIEIPFDLSEILFITTANSLDTIPRPLLDRMEVIRISGYTHEEKLHIANKHLLPKQLALHALKKSNIRIKDDTLREIIDGYTREAGVRTLERELARLCRKVARTIATTNKQSVSITKTNLHKFLGPKKYRYDLLKEKDEVGVVTGLAWTAVGGDTLSVEVNIMDGTGKIELTGHLGDVMKESAKAAISYIRSKSAELKIEPDFYKKYDIHIHVPEGATPKDGPSAGITMATALISALTNRPARKDVAMTGEITLRGRVLPIGGLKEKILAAYRMGIKTVILPKDNETDLEQIPDNVKSCMNFVLAEYMDTVIKHALLPQKEAPKSEKDMEIQIPLDFNVSENETHIEAKPY